MFIYLITNQINGKKYVGQTVQTVAKRWKRHCWESTMKRKVMAITGAIAVHGAKNFTIEQLEECQTIDQLNAAEEFWISKLATLSPTGYNLTPGGKSRGHLLPETRLKISLANKGRKTSDETRSRLSESHKGWVPSEETKEKWRKAFTGKKQSQAVVQHRITKLAKTYTMICPTGESVTFTNMKEFCKLHSLSESKMNQVANGKRTSYKEWKRK